MHRFLGLINVKGLNTVHGKARCDKLICVLECNQDRQIHGKTNAILKDDDAWD
jgi:hypothetical protein